MPLNRLEFTRLASLITFTLLLAGSSLFATNAWANQLIQTGKSSRISVVVDEAKLLRLAESADQIIIGNPGIADITIQNTKLLVLTGKSYGITNIIILNKHGETILNTRISVDDDHSRSVSLHMGTKRQSYHCTEGSICNGEADMGDNTEHLAQVTSNISTKTALGKKSSAQPTFSQNSSEGR